MSIEQETPLLPFVIAQRVVDEWVGWLDKFDALHRTGPDRIADQFWAHHEEIEAYLEQRAERTFEDNPVFRRAVLKSNRGDGIAGRDSLYAFMYHWLTSQMIKSFPQLRGHVPSTINGTSGTV